MTWYSPPQERVRILSERPSKKTCNLSTEISTPSTSGWPNLCHTVHNIERVATHPPPCACWRMAATTSSTHELGAPVPAHRRWSRPSWSTDDGADRPGGSTQQRAKLQRNTWSARQKHRHRAVSYTPPTQKPYRRTSPRARGWTRYISGANEDSRASHAQQRDHVRAGYKNVSILSLPNEPGSDTWPWLVSLPDRVWLWT